MESLCKDLTRLLDKPEEYLRPSDKQQAWVEQTRDVYNFLKGEEEKYSLPSSTESLQQINTDGLDTEQIWQVLELQNKSLLAASDDLEGLDDINLFYSVAKLSSLAKYNKLIDEEDEEKDAEEEDSSSSESSDAEDHPLTMGSDEEEDDDDNEGEVEDDDVDEGMGSSEGALSDEELFEKQDDGGLNLEFDENSDNEEDNFDELVVPEGMEDSDVEDDSQNMKPKVQNKLDPLNKNKSISDDESDEDEEKPVESEKKTENRSRKFAKTKVDSKFFNLRECEWVADNDAIGENYDDDSDDIDYMKDISDDEQMEGISYDDFFDGENKKRVRFDKTVADEDDDNGEELYDDEEDESQVQDSRMEEDSSDENQEVTQLLGLKKKEEKSTFEKERERERNIMNTLEDDNISEKPWFLKGEVVSADRPENSTLEEQLEYNVAARQKPVITEDTTALIEKVILTRIRSKAWNDVVRKVKADINPFEYKKKLVLDQEKSKKSLAEIYDEEYTKLINNEKDKEQEELPEHVEIREQMDKLFENLDALANYHFTPKMIKPDLKIKSNLPAVSMEEATPETAADATLLAPQEILAPVRGDLQGKTERTDTDRKRERRAKKIRQKKQAKKQKNKLQEQIKTSSLTGKKLTKEATMKFVEKAVKSGQVKLLENHQNKSVKSSQKFFKQLQETNAGANGKKTGPRHKKGTGDISASKLLL